VKQKEVSPDKQGKQQITRSKLRASAQITMNYALWGKLLNTKPETRNSKPETQNTEQKTFPWFPGEG